VRFAWRDRAGKLLETIGQPLDTAGSIFSLSPDGSRVAYIFAGVGKSDIWVLELAHGLSTQITFNGGMRPRWSPDGKHLYYSNLSGIHRKAADGSGEEVLLMKDGPPTTVNSVSPDGKHLLLGNGDIMKLPLTGDRKPEAHLQGKKGEFGAAFSPDGRWVAYGSDESGRREIYLQGFPEHREVAGFAEEAAFPWRADGRGCTGRSGRDADGGERGVADSGVRPDSQSRCFDHPGGVFPSSSRQGTGGGFWF
jgi:Tol biopolymer transport system component